MQISLLNPEAVGTDIDVTIKYKDIVGEAAVAIETPDESASKDIYLV